MRSEAYIEFNVLRQCCESFQGQNEQQRVPIVTPPHHVPQHQDTPLVRNYALKYPSRIVSIQPCLPQAYIALASTRNQRVAPALFKNRVDLLLEGLELDRVRHARGHASIGAL